MIIRSAGIDDARLIKDLHDRAVLTLCQGEYTADQLQTWVSSSSLEKYQQRLADHRTFVAERAGVMVGYVRWNPATAELCSIFVDPDHARQGIATRLMAHLYQDVAAWGVTDLWLDASLTAVPFYEKEGWRWVAPAQHGVLACVRMEKRSARDP